MSNLILKTCIRGSQVAKMCMGTFEILATIRIYT